MESFFSEKKIITRKIILELSHVETTYKEYCDLMGKKRLEEIASDETLLHLIMEHEDQKENGFLRNDMPFENLELIKLLYGIPFIEKDVEKKSFSISAENFLLYKIMFSFTQLGIPQYRKYELSQQLRYDVDEVFFAKIVRGKFGVGMLEEEAKILNELMYVYIKYNNDVKYYKDDRMTKYAYNFVVNNEIFLKFLKPIHYRENLTKNYLPFYLLYLTIYKGVELYIIYDHSERVNSFKICDEKESKKYIDKGCSILGLYDILVEAFEAFGNKEEPIISKRKEWKKVLDDIVEASERSITFKYTVEGSSGLPMLGQVEFVHTDITKFDELMQYAGDFGGVIPMQGTSEKKILEGKKKLNYKKDRKKDKNK